IRKIIVGQDKVISLLLAAILADGHVLIEGVPGIAKTLIAKLIAKTISAGFSRIQFTPDLMPSDILGTSVFNMKNSNFEFNRGPIFSNIILIDEINRAPAKTQSALFEVMEERQVTIDGKSYKMEFPFAVFATQNPIEHEGTYKLPEAQLDRFLFKVEMDYPSLDEELKILLDLHKRKDVNDINIIDPVFSKKLLQKLREQVRSVHIDEKVASYIAQIVNNTRNNNDLISAGHQGLLFLS
ncbi:MAG: AAA family ATPase, partial [Ignavibacteriaceae bacterium]